MQSILVDKQLTQLLRTVGNSVGSGRLWEQWDAVVMASWAPARACLAWGTVKDGCQNTMGWWAVTAIATAWMLWATEGACHGVVVNRMWFPKVDLWVRDCGCLSTVANELWLSWYYG